MREIRKLINNNKWELGNRNLEIGALKSEIRNGKWEMGNGGGSRRIFGTDFRTNAGILARCKFLI